MVHLTFLGLLVLRPSISSLLQSATSVIIKCDSFFYYKVRWSVITKCDSFFITKCDKCYYKVRQVLQSVTILLQSSTGITKCDDYTKRDSTTADTRFPLVPNTKGVNEHISTSNTRCWYLRLFSSSCSLNPSDVGVLW